MQQLSTIISPSPQWLQQCQSHLSRHRRSTNNNNNNNNGNDEEQRIFDQILYSDLRDVVLQSSSSSNAASKKLREAIEESNNNNNNNNANGKSLVDLNNGMPLMVQLEEAVDVSLNAEGMLQGGTHNNNNTNNTINAANHRRGNNNNNNNNSRSSNRMLKMVLSDGYIHHNNSYNNSNSTMLAMETSPITNLSTATSPGCKLLLFDKLTVRHGILQLNPQNTIVLGGKIDHWETLAEEKREKCRKIRGCGVDATVKALIWCPEGDNEGGDVDEGEGESSDVITPRQQPTPSSAAATGTAPMMATPGSSFNHRGVGSNTHNQTISNNNNYNNNNTAASNFNNNIRAQNNVYNNNQNQNQNQYSVNTTTAAATAFNNNSASKSNPYQRNSGNGNPYQQNNNGNSAAGGNGNQQNNNGNNVSNNGNPYQPNGNGISRSYGNPYQQNSSGSSSNPYQQNSSSNTASNPYQRNPSHNNANGMNPYYANNSRTTSQSSFPHNQSFNNNASQSSSQHSYSNQGTSFQGAATSSNVTNNYGTANVASRVSDIQPVNHGSSGNSSSSLSHNITQQQSQPKSVNPYAPRTSPSNPPAVTPATSKKGNGTSSQGMTSQTPSTVPSFPTTNNNNNTTTSSSPPDRGSESLSFSELRTRLLQMSQHQGLYEENWGKTFIVPCKLRTGSTIEENPMFNIQKVKKGKKCGKKHEFLLQGHLLGPRSADGFISCRVESELMEPYFGELTPTEIRKLQKTEKERANKVVNESSKQFLHEFKSLAEFYMKLALGPDEFFGKVSERKTDDSWVEDKVHPTLVVFERKTF